MLMLYITLFAVAIVAAFFLCWAPFHTQRLMTASIPDGYWTKPLLEIQSVLFFISGTPSSFLLVSYRRAENSNRRYIALSLLED